MDLLTKDGVHLGDVTHSVVEVSVRPSLPHALPLITASVSTRTSILSFLKLTNQHRWPPLLCSLVSLLLAPVRPHTWMGGNQDYPGLNWHPGGLQTSETGQVILLSGPHIYMVIGFPYEVTMRIK